MKRPQLFFRLFFAVICCLTLSAYELSSPVTDGIGGSSANTLAGSLFAIVKGILLGATAFGTILLAERILKKCPMRTITTAAVGLLVGTIMAQVVGLSMKLFLNALSPNTELSTVVILFTFLSCIYLGIMLTANSSESWWLSIPFVRLAPASQSQRKEILLDTSALEDPRLMELARSGLLDHALVVPTFITKEIQKAMESTDETVRMRARRCYEHLKRLENIPNLGLQVREFHFAETEESGSKLGHAAKLLQAYILTAQDQCLLKTEDDDAVVISLETISSALKPGAQRGEFLQIKIQRLGKEPKQGVGYLDDGTMVVVNGGGEFLGQLIRTQVLSQKYSSSGKIVFCNAIPEENDSFRTQVFEESPYVTV